jgi:hypothetical protein
MTEQIRNTFRIQGAELKAQATGALTVEASL